MSVEASKWARMADVQKSSSKLVLLNLAQLVRYDADDWTVFASIEYLAKVTHLNRKTVIDAIGRLRKLGAIKDTGRRAGDNRSSIIYLLCPRAVPLVDLAATNAAAVDTPSQTNMQNGLDLGEEEESPDHADPAALVPQASAPFRQLSKIAEAANSASFESDAECSEFDAFCSGNEASHPDNAPVHSEDREFCFAPTRAGAASVTGEHSQDSLEGKPSAKVQNSGQAHGDNYQPHGRNFRNSQNSGNSKRAGPGATRLPAAWSLPEKWRIWTQRERPLWSVEKIDGLAATFSAYMRSRPGQAGESADWFESWRLWVFRERQSKLASKPWYHSWSGIVAEGKVLGLDKAPNEPEAHFKARVFCAAGLPPPH